MRMFFIGAMTMLMPSMILLAILLWNEGGFKSLHDRG
jgi:hypothetical protein